MHGYELKQRLVDLGFWRISFGSVYPALRRLERAEFIEVSPGSGRRKEYRITADGKEHFQQILEDEASEVENTSAFRARLAFFKYMNPETRIEFLERRKTVLREKRIASAHVVAPHGRSCGPVHAFADGARGSLRRGRRGLAGWLARLRADHDEGQDAPGEVLIE